MISGEDFGIRFLGVFFTDENSNIPQRKGRRVLILKIWIKQNSLSNLYKYISILTNYQASESNISNTRNSIRTTVPNTGDISKHLSKIHPFLSTCSKK